MKFYSLFNLNEHVSTLSRRKMPILQVSSVFRQLHCYFHTALHLPWSKAWLNLKKTPRGNLSFTILRVSKLRFQIKNEKSANIYQFNVNNENTRIECKISSRLTKMILEWRQRRCFGVFVVNFEHISYLFLVVLTADFEQVNVCWEHYNVLNQFKVISWNSKMMYLVMFWCLHC